MEALGIFLGGLIFAPIRSSPPEYSRPLGQHACFTASWNIWVAAAGGGGGGLQTYFSSFSCENFVVDKSCLLLIPVTWYPEYCPASGLACLFHGALEHMGDWREGGGTLRSYFLIFCGNFVVDKSCLFLILSLDMRKTTPPPGQHACFTALWSI